ncbi:hypothetical protein [Hyphomicrobium sp. ghe19]|uniref:hypothetical protein n=1 Tax=Hyphomicrobium sp. ghe19 TaxID=2682968 RepID=UPI001366A17C|nr:hypothetical protein HYPP_02788 [Hyphomicrobium sp. ghe19]
MDVLDSVGWGREISPFIVMSEAFFALAKSTELWAAIVGAVVGGLIAVAVQLIALRETRSVREQDHKRQREALANSLIFKSMRIFSTAHGLHQHFIESDVRAAADGCNGESWQKYLPIANPPEPIHFSHEEMGMLLALKDSFVFNAMMNMDVRHNSALATLRAFNDSRASLTQAICSVASLDAEEGRLVSHSIPLSETAKLRPMMIEVNSLADDLKAHVASDFVRAKQNLQDLQALFKKELGFSYKLEVVRPRVILERVIDRRAFRQSSPLSIPLSKEQNPPRAPSERETESALWRWLITLSRPPAGTRSGVSVSPS